MEESKSKIYWHDAFFEAVQLELADYRDVLEFKNEHHLSQEALKIDVMVIKKTKNIEIKKNFGRIFKGYNVFEYKSESDSLSISDYDKVNGYARLYAAFEKQVTMQDMTITFVATGHPRELFKYIKNILKFEIIEVYQGVYYIEGADLPIQVLKSDALSEEDNLYLKSLRSNLKPQSLADLLEMYQKQVGRGEKNAYLDRITEANKNVLKEVLKMGLSAEVRDIIMEGAEKNGWLEEFVAKKVEERAEEKAEEKVKIIKLEVERARLAEQKAEKARIAEEKARIAEEKARIAEEKARIAAEEKVEKARLEMQEKAEKARLEMQEKAVEVAKKMLKKGLSAEDVSEYTGLPMDSIMALQQ